ncbi:RsmB/NOP family class I SAM-dependent RNA methyltransferase [Labedella endophytica]|uniref:rRNA small subunit methyltransferase B n=1 Tax=Labedella endophytica TaxID=1523160 RepID=A0A433JR91_9MICO|nr:transcription antitermination factor NusB [Labedella endophytica]RUR00710.1 rRNA small subunit methyltransferase B [Labedella endophytica]
MTDDRRRSRPDERIQPARLVAFDVISAVSRDDAYANLLLPGAIAAAGLDRADAALATELCYGTLRMSGYYDRIIAIAAGRPVGQIDETVLDALRLGCHQVIGMRVADHAAVNESVALVRRYGSRSAVGFANGVLRAITRRSPDAWTRAVSEAATSADDREAALTSHPEWVLRAFRRSLAAEGRESELSDLLRADNDAPAVNFAALPGLASRPAEASPNRFSPVGFTGAGGDPDAVVTAAAGRVRVQDEGSQLVALALARARPVVPGETWLDLCAGPGGKTALLAAEALAAGAHLTANELVPARAELVRRAVAPVPLDVPVTVLDGTTVGERHPLAFDRVLVDAPCTGLGALRRRPEARWRKQPRDVAELADLQARLLDSAIAATRPGGLVAYVTCSPHLAETRAVVSAAVRRSRGRVSELDAGAVLRGIAGDGLDLGDDGERLSAQLWPHRHATDAMFIALLAVAE